MRLAVAALLLIAACSGTDVDRDEWRAMAPADRVLYVKALLGEEIAKERKGGNDRVFPQSAEEYVKRIEAAYAEGDARDPREIFRELGTAR